MTEIECPFCQIVSARSKEALIGENEHAAAFYDKYPLNDGHALVVPKRHESDFFNLLIEEQLAIWELLNDLQMYISEQIEPDGFNVGVNISESAGQTVGHAHVHLIPRFEGDTANPRGGVRWAIPERAPYWADDITLVETLRMEASSSIEAIARFHTPGWAYQGTCHKVNCAACSESQLDIWRKPYEDKNGKPYRYWGIYCKSCEQLSDLRPYASFQKTLLREWSKENETPFVFTGEWTPEADKALLDLYQSGRSMASIKDDWGLKWESEVRGRLDEHLLFNENFKIPFKGSYFKESDSFQIMLNETWESCSELESWLKTEIITHEIFEWAKRAGWFPTKEEPMDIPSEICNSGEIRRKGRVDIWCEPIGNLRGLAIEIDRTDKAISISKLIKAGVDGYIPIWVRHTMPVEIDVPEQIHLISLAQNEIVDIDSL